MKLSPSVGKVSRLEDTETAVECGHNDTKKTMYLKISNNSNETS